MMAPSLNPQGRNGPGQAVYAAAKPECPSGHAAPTAAGAGERVSGALWHFTIFFDRFQTGGSGNPGAMAIAE
jgi:hypothetical protein